MKINTAFGYEDLIINKTKHDKYRIGSWSNRHNRK